MDLSHNTVSTLPAAFPFSLRSLNIANNPIDSISVHLVNHPLAYLNISHTNIKQFPGHKENWNELEELDWKGNSLTQKEQEEIKMLLGNIEIEF